MKIVSTISTMYIQSTDLKCELIEYEGKKIMLYTNSIPALLILIDGNIDPIVTDGIVMYHNNKKEIDKWLRNQNIIYDKKL